LEITTEANLVEEAPGSAMYGPTILYTLNINEGNQLPISQMLVQQPCNIKIECWLREFFKHCRNPDEIRTQLHSFSVLAASRAFTPFNTFSNYNEMLFKTILMPKIEALRYPIIKVDLWAIVKSRNSLISGLVGERIWTFYGSVIYQLSLEKDFDVIQRVYENILTLALSKYEGQHQNDSRTFLTTYIKRNDAVHGRRTPEKILMPIIEDIDNFIDKVFEGSSTTKSRSTILFERLYEGACIKCQNDGGVLNAYKSNDMVHLLRQLFKIVCLWTAIMSPIDSNSETIQPATPYNLQNAGKKEIQEFIMERHAILTKGFQNSPEGNSILRFYCFYCF
jgi:hypothetical protein